MAIPLLDLKAQHETIRGDVEAALRRVFEHQRFILGEEVSRFEAAVAELLGVEATIGVSSGSDALYLALRALDVGPGDEVITTVYTFFATAGAVVRCGATPIFVDVDPVDLNLDIKAALARVGPRTKALLPVHLFGRCTDLEALRQAALPIIEDAAQAIGARSPRGAAGALGDVGCFSFFPSKNLGGAGDGGLLSTSDPALAARLRSLRVHGQSRGGRYEHDEVGGNYRLDALQAAVLGAKLPHLKGWNAARQRNAARYREIFTDADLGDALTLPPAASPDSVDVYNQFVIRVEGRDALQAHLREAGIGSAVYYPRPLHLQPCFAHLGGQPGDCPVAEAAATESLALPVHPELKSAHIDEICSRVIDFLRP